MASLVQEMHDFILCFKLLQIDPKLAWNVSRAQLSLGRRWLTFQANQKLKITFIWLLPVFTQPANKISPSPKLHLQISILFPNVTRVVFVHQLSHLLLFNPLKIPETRQGILVQWRSLWWREMFGCLWYEAQFPATLTVQLWSYSQRHTCQPPEHKNLETNPKICKVGAIFISGPFFWLSLFSMQ